LYFVLVHAALTNPSCSHASYGSTCAAIWKASAHHECCRLVLMSRENGARVFRLFSGTYSLVLTFLLSLAALTNHVIGSRAQVSRDASSLCDYCVEHCMEHC
jgi:hypothetical protein